MISLPITALLAQALASPAAKLPLGPVAPGAVPKSAATLSPQLLQQLANQAVHPLTPLQANVPWLPHIIATVFIISAVLLIVLLAVQTTKQEGLSGTIGGRVESAYRPRLGFDQQLARITTFIAITFVLFGTLVSFTGT